MNRKNRVITGSALAVFGVAMVLANFVVPSDTLNASGVGEIPLAGIQLFVWIGIAMMVISALLFISASQIDS